MIGFASPWWLTLQVIPLLLVFWVWTRRSGHIALPLDHGDHQHTAFWPVVLKIAESLPAVLLSVVLFILAVPQQMGVPNEVRSVTNIQFCVDVSLSMNDDFGDKSRYEHAMSEINKFVEYRTGDAFGLSFFGNVVIHWVPLTTDPSALKCSTPFMNPKRPNHPRWLHGTKVGNALLACRNVLKSRAEGDRLIVLISDGVSSDLQEGRAEEVAALLRDENITVIDVHVAAEEVPPEIGTIAMLTGGEVFNPSDPETLERVFERIDELMKVEIEQTVGQPMDYFGPFCIAGLSLLGVYLVSLMGLRYTPW